MKRFEPRFGGLQSLFFFSSSPFPLIITTNAYSTKPSTCLTSIRNDFAPQSSVSLIDDKRDEHMRWFLLSHSFLLDQLELMGREVDIFVYLVGVTRRKVVHST